jgi:hypothetical protein
MDKLVMLLLEAIHVYCTACNSSEPNQGLCILEEVRMRAWHCQDLTWDRRNVLLES